MKQKKLKIGYYIKRLLLLAAIAYLAGYVLTTFLEVI